jgi:hypothetical protein
MDTIRGEPAWVNMSEKEWEIEEAMQDAATVGAMINDDFDRLSEALPQTSEEWAKHYDLNGKLELAHHELLKLHAHFRFLGVIK